MNRCDTPGRSGGAGAAGRGGERGVALVLVLGVVLMLSILAIGFSFTMQVEVKLAALRRQQVKAEALARAGVELARYLLWLDMDPEYDDGADSLLDVWADNPDWLRNHELGEGVINVVIRPEESRIDLNTIPPELLREILFRYDLEESEVSTIVDSIGDWIDVDNVTKLNGAEDDDYLRFDPPYECKDGPFDSVEELLLVNGMTEEILYERRPVSEDAEETPGPRLIDLFTVAAGGRINVNTAPAEILAVLPGFDEQIARAIVDYRNGDDGVEGTEDDRPFLQIGELASVPGMDAAVGRQAQRLLGVRSVFFRVRCEGRVGQARKVVRVVLRRDRDDVRIVGWYEGAGN